MKKFCKILESLFVISLTVVLCSCPGDDIFDDKESSGGGIENNDGSSEGENNEDIPDNNNLTGVHQGYRWVDLGLSVKWATCNVGAISPEESGGYYAWGETEEKSNYGYYNYKYYKYSEEDEEMPFITTKYVKNKEFGVVDNKSTLEPNDDVAHVKWGGNWRIPTKLEWYELYEKCTWDLLTSINTVKVTGPNGNSIFLPAAGIRYDDELEGIGVCYYWSSSLEEEYCYLAWNFIYSVDDEMKGCTPDYPRFYGFSIRPVCE